ncbi:hypothetical protein HYQ46_011007 [Verticillium longisporum]|nr:hypothetical protein HYQ46_011007 [Verticillium longisporum]
MGSRCQSGQVIDDKRPLATVSIGGDTKDDGAHRTEHEHQRDAPRDVRLRLAKLLGQLRNGQGNGEEVESIPRLRRFVASVPWFTPAAKATPKNAHWWRFSILTRRQGFGAASIGGFKVLNLVAR